MDKSAHNFNPYPSGQMTGFVKIMPLQMTLLRIICTSKRI